MIETIFGRYLPNKVVALAAPEDKDAAPVVPLLAGRTTVAGRVTAYVCRNFYCEEPVTEVEQLRTQLGGGK